MSDEITKKIRVDGQLDFCPFCGEDVDLHIRVTITRRPLDRISGDYEECRIYCRRCELSIAGKTKEEIISVWNRRYIDKDRLIRLIADNIYDFRPEFREQLVGISDEIKKRFKGSWTEK